MSKSILPLRRNFLSSIGCYHVAITLISVLGFTNAQEPVHFPQGANTFFMGHSFFIPISEKFDFYAGYAGNGQSYPNHEFDSYFRGGAGGSPLNLWEFDKAEIEAKLTNNTELFGMTIGGSSTRGEAPNVTDAVLLNGYTQWIDLALEYNSEMSFFLGMPWPDFPADYGSPGAFEAHNDEISASVFEFVSDLRDLYPDTNIFFLDYGAIAVEAVNLFARDELVDITSFSGSGSTSLFTDEKGHSGDMIKELSGLFWVIWLYGAEGGDIVRDATRGLGWDQTNVVDIFMAAAIKNQGYRLYD